MKKPSCSRLLMASPRPVLVSNLSTPRSLIPSNPVDKRTEITSRKETMVMDADGFIGVVSEHKYEIVKW